MGKRELEAYRERRGGEVLKTRDARPARCRYCSRLAPNGLTVRFYLLLLVPIWSTTIHFCDAHEGEVSRLTARLARGLSNFLWGRPLRASARGGSRRLADLAAGRHRLIEGQ